jgi:hypothetical protein
MIDNGASGVQTSFKPILFVSFVERLPLTPTMPTAERTTIAV